MALILRPDPMPVEVIRALPALPLEVDELPVDPVDPVDAVDAVDPVDVVGAVDPVDPTDPIVELINAHPPQDVQFIGNLHPDLSKRRTKPQRRGNTLSRPALIGRTGS
jgi:hypothetical protein